jgi:hypothetical protein
LEGTALLTVDGRRMHGLQESFILRCSAAVLKENAALKRASS